MSSLGPRKRQEESDGHDEDPMDGKNLESGHRLYGDNRPQNLGPLLDAIQAAGLTWDGKKATQWAETHWDQSDRGRCDGPTPWPPPNIWLGTSVSTQEDADKNIPALLQIPAAVRFVSLEPLLDAVTLKRVAYSPRQTTVIQGTVLGTDGSVFSPCGASGKGLDWAIVGSESGPNRRPCKLEWVREIRDECQEAGVPLFIKQLHIDGKLVKDIEQFPEDLRIQEYPQS